MTGKIGTNPKIKSNIKLLWILGMSLVLAIVLSFYQVWKPITLSNPPASSSSPSSPEVQQKVDSWLLNYPDLSQAQSRHRAFQDITKILQQYENAAQEIKKVVLLNHMVFG